MSNISIHVLREEDDTEGLAETVQLLIFLSTSSARRTTILWFRYYPPSADFYPRPPRGGRRKTYMFGPVPILISIHVLREEDDAAHLSVGRGDAISIHVLREEDDSGCR